MFHFLHCCFWKSGNRQLLYRGSLLDPICGINRMIPIEPYNADNSHLLSMYMSKSMKLFCSNEYVPISKLLGVNIGRYVSIALMNRNSTIDRFFVDI